MRSLLIVLAELCLGLTQCLPAEEPLPATKDSQVRMAIERAIPLLEKASAGSAEQRQCFTCHSQAIPVLALTTAQKLGFDVDSDNLKRQIIHTFTHLQRGKKKYEDGKGQGGRIVTAGYALWTLEAGDHPPDEVTSAVTEFLLEHQKDSDHWQQSSKRPPTSGSPFMTSYVAVRGLKSFGTKEQQERITQRCSSVETWLNNASPKDTEDQVFHLRLLSVTEGRDTRLKMVAKDLLTAQRTDGGWAQHSGFESDAYATGTVVSTLLETNLVEKEDAGIRRAVAYLVREQKDDGSWYVQTRANGFQEYFESGFPHNEHQFISTSASAWSTLALLHSLNINSDVPENKIP